MIESFFSPEGVAVVGASGDAQKLGFGVVRNLVEHGYRGRIYPVNPTTREILGLRCYPSLADVPDPVDLAVVVVPAPAVVEVIEACGRRGIRHAVVVSGGFRETGPEGAAREQALAAAARRHGVRLIGPNCIGTIDTHTPVNTTFVTGMPRPGEIGFVSHSGAICAVVIDWARSAGVGFSRIVSLGNQVDVNEAEALAALASDPQTQVITAYLEGVADGRTFLQLAAETARRKPLVVIKAGSGESGARAVASHTGALAGDAQVFDVALRKAGVIRATTMEELLDWARALAWQPLPRGNRVAVLTNAGGPGILAVDALEAAGLRLAPLADATREYLRACIPPAGSANNPVDILAGSGPGAYAVALDALLADPTVDAALVITAPNDWFLPSSLAETICDVAAAYRKPVLVSLIGLAPGDPAQAILNRRRVPNLAFPERAGPTLSAMVARSRWLATAAEVPALLEGIDADAARAALGEGDLSGLLAAYGVALPPSRLAATAEEAAQAAAHIGYPVALKLVSPDITHKSDAGGVVLGLRGAAEVRDAFERIVAVARAAVPGAAIEGVLVQQMLSGGQELIVGVRRDPQFGPVVLAGTGGVEVELVRDVALDLAPLSRGEAGRLLDQTRAGLRLAGWRGAPASDRAAAVEAIVRLAQLACDLPQVAELEINPLYVLPAGRGAIAIDIRGRIVRD